MEIIEGTVGVFEVFCRFCCRLRHSIFTGFNYSVISVHHGRFSTHKKLSESLTVSEIFSDVWSIYELIGFCTVSLASRNFCDSNSNFSPKTQSNGPLVPLSSKPPTPSARHPFNHNHNHPSRSPQGTSSSRHPLGTHSVTDHAVSLIHPVFCSSQHPFQSSATVSIVNHSEGL